MKRVMITDPVYEGMTGEVVDSCLEDGFVRVKLDVDGSYVIMATYEIIEIKGENI